MQRTNIYLAAVFTLLAHSLTRPAVATEVDGFTEPYRKVVVGAADSGIIAQLLVKEGDDVEEGQPLAHLDSEVHEALLAIAEQNTKAQGRIESAVAELKLRKDRWTTLTELRAEGHVREEEVDRAETELEVAKAELKAAREDQLIRQLEYEKTKAQLKRRTIFAPISGVVTVLHKQQGEFVANNNPDVLTVVELDRVVASFLLSTSAAEQHHVGQAVDVRFSRKKQTERGVIEFISPVTNAESNTVRVRVRLENPGRKLRSGDHCALPL